MKVEKAVKVEKNVLEWSVFGVSLALLLALLGVLLFEALVDDEETPELTVEFGPLTSGNGQPALPVLLRNGGNRTVQELEIEVMLHALAGGAEESVRLRFPYVPKNSALRGWVHFRRDPAQAEFRARIVSYTMP